MHFTGAVAYTILIASGSYAQSTTVQVVNVGASNGALTFNPNSIQAKTGDVVQFQFTSGVRSTLIRSHCTEVLTESTEPLRCSSCV